jgi:hypothetical protein
MNKMFTFYTNRYRCFFHGVFKTKLVLFVGIALSCGFWIASMPMAHGQASRTPVEMIQSKLPQGKTIPTATDTQLLDAVCKAVKQWPRETPLIVRTAAGARKSVHGDILCMAIRCNHDDKQLVDCGWVVDIVREWNRAYPEEASRLTEMVVQCAPDCRDALQGGLGEGNFENPPINVNPPPGSVGGGSGGNVCIVCHNGQEIEVACSDLDNFLKGHPGDFAGPCQPTPVTNP